MSWGKEEIQQTLETISNRAKTDEEFRALAISDINQAIKEVSGKDVPAGFRINIIDNSAYHVAFILPALEKADGELSESELESVAGGSKAGAENFFGGFVEGALNGTVNTDSDEGIAGGVIGAITFGVAHS